MHEQAGEIRRYLGLLDPGPAYGETRGLLGLSVVARRYETPVVE